MKLREAEERIRALEERVRELEARPSAAVTTIMPFVPQPAPPAWQPWRLVYDNTVAFTTC